MKTPEQQSILAAEILGFEKKNNYWWKDNIWYYQTELPKFHTDKFWRRDPDTHAIHRASGKHAFQLAVLGAFLKANGKDIE